MTSKLRLTAAIFAVATLFVTSAAAQTYPVKPIRMIIPFPPGGGSDVTARVVATALSERLGQQVIADNRPGAGGVIGSELAANAPKDGHTLLMVSLAHTVNPWLYDLKGRYDPIKSFVPVALIAASPVVLVVNPAMPVQSVADLVNLAKKQPGKLQYASAGVGSVTHLAGELFKYTAKVDMLHVPFKGGGPSMIDVIGGHTKVVFSSLVQTTPHLKSGKLRALGVGSKARSKVLPDVPSVAEAGVPSYEAVNWWGIVAPAGTPQPVIDRLHAALTASQDSAEVEKQFASEGATVVKKSPTEFGAFMVGEMNKWEQVVKKGGIKAE